MFIYVSVEPPTGKPQQIHVPEASVIHVRAALVSGIGYKRCKTAKARVLGGH